jgi:predicted amino acid racemase
MADVRTRNEIVANDGTTYVTFGANYLKHVINQADVGREQIIKIAKTDMTNAELSTIIQEITTAGGAGAANSDAFTVAAVGTATGAAFVSGTTDVVFLRVQGTGTYTAEGSNAHGVTGAVTTIEATFTPAL